LKAERAKLSEKVATAAATSLNYDLLVVKAADDAKAAAAALTQAKTATRVAADRVCALDVAADAAAARERVHATRFAEVTVTLTKADDARATAQRRIREVERLLAAERDATTQRAATAAAGAKAAAAAGSVSDDVFKAMRRALSTRANDAEEVAAEAVATAVALRAKLENATAALDDAEMRAATSQDAAAAAEVTAAAALTKAAVDKIEVMTMAAATIAAAARRREQATALSELDPLRADRAKLHQLEAAHSKLQKTLVWTEQRARAAAAAAVEKGLMSSAALTARDDALLTARGEAKRATKKAALETSMAMRRVAAAIEDASSWKLKAEEAAAALRRATLLNDARTAE
jgi:hypothetical protein